MAGGQRASSSNISGLILVAVVAAVAANLMAVTTAATTHTVGGGTGWKIPSNANVYSEWASGQSFVVGDTLVFSFVAQGHDVIEVPKSSYDACSTSNQIGSTYTSTPASVPLTTPGNHYYICGFSGHCSAGQKLAITVASSAPPGTTSGTPGTDGGIDASSPTSPAAGNAPRAAPSSLPSAATFCFALLSSALYFFF